MQNFIFPNSPRWLASNIHYLTVMGSHAYGVATDDSDFDIYGICVPPKSILVPHLEGYIVGLDKNIPTFNQYQEKINDTDHSIYSVLKYFSLLSDGNANILDSIFVPVHCIKHITQAFTVVREHRHLFLSKQCFEKFRGYAFSQKSKINNRKNSDEWKALEDFDKQHNLPESYSLQDALNNRFDLPKPSNRLQIRLYEEGLAVTNRFENIKIFGYDTKFAYHVCRLLLECEEILTDYDLTLNKNVEILTEIRSGLWSLNNVDSFFENKLKILEELYRTSTVPNDPAYKAIKSLYKEFVNSVYKDVYN